MDKMLFQFNRIGFCDDIHTKQRRALKVEDVIKCALNLTKADLKAMKYSLKETERWIDTDTLSKVLNLDIPTIQRSVKKKCMKKKFCRGPSKTWTEEAMFLDIKSIQELK